MRPEGKTLILTYHRVDHGLADPWSLCVSPSAFSGHLDVITRDWYPLSLRQLVGSLERGSSLPDRSVVVTFDDGYADNLYQAAPLLLQHQVPATVFLVTGQLGRGAMFWWDELERLVLHPGSLPARLRLRVGNLTFERELGDLAQYGPRDAEQYGGWRAWEEAPTIRHSIYRALWDALQPLDTRERQGVLDELRALAAPAVTSFRAPRRLTADEIVALSRDPWIEIGAHTVTHPTLASLATSVQRREIEECRHDLAALIGRPAAAFAYPYGADCNYTTETVDLVRQAGFSAGCTTHAAPVMANSDVFRLPRHQVENWDADQFSRRLEQWLEDAPTRTPD